MKKLNVKNLRQGQTIHIIKVNYCEYRNARPNYSFNTYMLYSQKQSLPKPGSTINKMPVNHLKKIMRVLDRGLQVYYSRKKAISAVKLLNR